jgi:hypothetical protein
LIWLNREHLDAIPYREVVAIDVSFKVGHHLFPIHEGVRLIAVVLSAGQLDHPVGGDQGEGIPAVAPGIGRPGRFFKDHMLATVIFKVVTCR